MKTNLKHWKEFEKQAQSKFKIVGLLDWFNSLSFEFNEGNFFIIGLDSEDHKTFIFQSYVNEDLIKEEYSTAPEQLNNWLTEINNTNFTESENLNHEPIKPF